LAPKTVSASRPILAVSSGPLWRLETPHAFEVIKSSGAEGIEIMVTQSTDTQNPNALEQLANRNDLPIVAVHAPQLLLTRNVFSSNQLEKVRRTVELAKALGAQTIVLHPPYAWHVRYSLWVLHELQDMAQVSPTITMENMFPVHVGRRRLRFHRFGGLEHLDRYTHVTLDTSHLAVAEADIVDAYRALADRVVHVHLSDNRGKGRDSHAPIGDGILPVDDFVRGLDNPALRCVALEIEPGPRAEEPGYAESVFGTSLERVRANLPAPQAR
jgi:sugar phosphate isomerase/epimerase